MTVWQGRYENYYSKDGIVYIDTKTNTIRTAFKADQFDELSLKILEAYKMEKNNSNRKELPDRIHCPLYKKEIDSSNCFDISMVVDKLAPKRTIPKEIRNIDTYKEICKKCQYHDV